MTRTSLGSMDLANAPLGTVIASAVVAVLAVVLTFSQPATAQPGPAAGHPAATVAGAL